LFYPFSPEAYLLTGTLFYHVMGRNEVSSSPSIAALLAEEDSSLSLRMKKRAIGSNKKRPAFFNAGR
jgi:hypothetical protein